MEVRYQALGVRMSKTASGADLGGSSKHSNESFEKLKWRKVSCEQHLDMGYSILQDKGVLHTQALLRIFFCFVY